MKIDSIEEFTTEKIVYGFVCPICDYTTELFNGEEVDYRQVQNLSHIECENCGEEFWTEEE